MGIPKDTREIKGPWRQWSVSVDCGNTVEHQAFDYHCYIDIYMNVCKHR